MKQSSHDMFFNHTHGYSKLHGNFRMSFSLQLVHDKRLSARFGKVIQGYCDDRKLSALLINLKCVIGKLSIS